MRRVRGLEEEGRCFKDVFDHDDTRVSQLLALESRYSDASSTNRMLILTMIRSSSGDVPAESTAFLPFQREDGRMRT
jgi:hypothetical protein